MYRLMIASLLLATFVAEAVQAAAFCVTTSVELQAALDTAATNGEDDSIRITAGLHQAPVGGFAYDATGTEEFALAMVGGFVSSGADPCAIAGTASQLSYLEGRHAVRIMQIVTPGDVSIRRLAFANGKASAKDRLGGGLAIVIYGASSVVSIERSAFLDNEAHSGGGLYLHQIADGNARVTVRNTLFFDNTATADGGGGLVLDLPAQASAYLHNNSLLENSAADGAGGIHLNGPELDVLVANNNFWGNLDQATNTPIDFSMLGGPGANLVLLHNNISMHTGFMPSIELNNISVDPLYEPYEWQYLEFNFTPARNSLLVDAGALPPMNMPQWHLGPADFLGNPRVVGSTVDIGAYENDRIFVGDFEE